MMLKSNMMFVDKWEDFNQRRMEFREEVRKILIDAHLAGAFNFRDTRACAVIQKSDAEEYANKVLEDLF